MNACAFQVEKRLRKIYPEIEINDVINGLVEKKALKLVREKRTVKISTLNKGVGSMRFYAIWLYLLEK